MRNKIDANEYKNFILGFLFYKYLSDKEISYLINDMGFTFDDLKSFEFKDIANLEEDEKDNVKLVEEELKKHIGYAISYSDLLTTWIKKGFDFEIADVRDAFSRFVRSISEEYHNVFDRIFDGLQNSLSFLGENASKQTAMVREILEIVNMIPTDGKEGYDVLGFIYEYLISMFAQSSGTKSGEFYSPAFSSKLISMIIADHLKDRKAITVLDSCAGSGSLLISIGAACSKYMDNSKISYYAQELNPATYNLTRMNLVMRGIYPDAINTHCGDSLEEDWPFFSDNEAYNFLPVDAAAENPPYSQSYNPIGKENDPRYKDYGLPPKSKADLAFLLHSYYHIKDDGIMCIILPHGVLFRGGEEEQIRKNLLERGAIDTVIGIAPGCFYGTGIPVVILVLRKNRTNKDVLFIDASKLYVKEGTKNNLTESQIKRIFDTYKNREDVEKFAYVASMEEIRKNSYNLNIPRYVDSAKDNEMLDINAIVYGGVPKAEVELLKKYWKNFDSLKQELFTETVTNYTSFKAKNIEDVVKNNNQVIAFREELKKEFSIFSSFLKELIITNLITVDIKTIENDAAEEAFKLLAFTDLIDKYDAYQVISDNFKIINNDLELIQQEGVEVIGKTEPAYVLKKDSDGSEIEVANGMKGVIIPFEQISEKYFKQLDEKINNIKDRIVAIISEKAEIFESLSGNEEVKEHLNKTEDGLAPASVSKWVKNYKKENKAWKDAEEDSIEFKLISDNALNEEDKVLKAEIKILSNEVQNNIEKKYCELTEQELLTLLEEKWIKPIMESLNALSENPINELCTKLKKLSNKYVANLNSVDSDIKNTENELLSMLDDIIGNSDDIIGLEGFKKLIEGIC